MLAYPLAVLHELGKLSLTEVSRDTADIHADNIAVFVGIHSGGVDCGECLLELLKRAIKGDFDIVIETAGEAQDACFLVLVGHVFDQSRPTGTGVERNDIVLRAKTTPLIHMGIVACTLDLFTGGGKPNGLSDVIVFHIVPPFTIRK